MLRVSTQRLDSHGHRPQDYSPEDFFGEYALFTQAYQADSLVPVKNNIIAPSTSYAYWSPEDIWNTGFVDAYTNYISHLAVEQ